MTSTYRISCIFLILFFLSCADDQNELPDFQYDYFPVGVSYSWIYDVDSISFFLQDENTNLVASDTQRYQVRELLESVFIDNEGDTAFRLERYSRANENEQWSLTDVWSVKRTETRAEKVEENLRFIKLTFPPQLNKEWDGNVYINIDADIDYLEDWVYTYTTLGDSYSINGLTFEETCRILHIDFETLIDKVYSEEVYAEGVGLVYKRLLSLGKQNVANPWTKPESGFVLEMKLKEYER